MAQHRFKQVNVFSSDPLLGNPVAVVLDADGIEVEKMQRIAAWTNLSETTFLLQPSSPDADYRLRIFTPRSELPFAGHPIIGSAHAALEGGVLTAGSTSLRQECGAGVLSLMVEGSGPERRIVVSAPEARVVRDCGDATDAISTALGGIAAASPAPLAIDVGPLWLVVRMADAQTVRGLRPDVSGVVGLSRVLGVVGVTAFCLDPGGDAAVHLRTFAPAVGVPEDPVCGSCNVALAAYLRETGLLEETGEEYIASQGEEMGRDGRVSVRVREGGRDIEIGGCAVTTVDGQISL